MDDMLKMLGYPQDNCKCVTCELMRRVRELEEGIKEHKSELLEHKMFIRSTDIRLYELVREEKP